jgi:transcriptional regulator with XRE-family HTH domain
MTDKQRWRDMKLSKLRKAKDITQVELAQKLGVTQSTVSMWERGVSIPQTKDLGNIAQTLGVTVEELYKCLEK